MIFLIGFIISFIIVYLFYFITVVLQKKRYDKFKQSNQVMYFVRRYNIDINKVNMRKFTNVIALSNSFVIASAFTATFLVKNIFLQLLVGLLVLIPLMLLVYHLIGVNLQKQVK